MVMSTYCRNRPEKGCPNLLRRALDSILSQTFEDWELVLIDDCSTDGTEEVCREYAAKDSRIRSFRAKKNSGMPAVRYNEGMRLARSDLFMYMFDDDELYPDGMRFLVEAMREERDCGMVYGLSNHVDARTGAVLLVGGDWNYEQLKRDNRFCVLCNLSVIVKKEVVNDVGGYDEDPLFKKNCDWDLWVRIGGSHRVVGIWKLIGRTYQGYADGISKTVDMSEENLREVLRIQGIQGRRVRLQGEMYSLVDSVLEGYEEK